MNMIKNIYFAGIFFLGALAAPAFAALSVGEAAPDFKARAALAGGEFDFVLTDALKKGPVVIYFYPSAYTNGCNLQARTFAVNREAFVEVGATVIGVSLDSIARLKEFSADPEYCGGKVAVASDSSGVISKAYGLHIREARAGRKDTRGADIEHGSVERTTYVVKADGRIAATIEGLAPVDNVARALDAVRSLAGRTR